MAYDFKQFKQKLEQAKDWLKQEYSGIRTGRATPAILDGVKVEAYNTKMPVNQIASISSEDPRTLRITPWDMDQSKSIEKAVQDANLGLSVTLDDKGVRIHFPELSEERRMTLMKVCKQKLEEARVKVRTEREGVWEEIQSKTESGEISEDDKFRLKEEMQKIVDDINKELEEMVERKEKEILEK